jgi:hypothetical protein
MRRMDGGWRACLFRYEIADMIDVADAVGAQFFRVGEFTGGSW